MLILPIELRPFGMLAVWRRVRYFESSGNSHETTARAIRFRFFNWCETDAIQSV